MQEAEALEIGGSNRARRQENANIIIEILEYDEPTAVDNEVQFEVPSLEA